MTGVRSPMDTKSGPAFILVSVGNTRTQLGLSEDGQVLDVSAHANSEPESLRGALARIIESRAGIPAVIASVNGPVADSIEKDFESFGIEVYRLGRDVGIQLMHSLDDDSTVGEDRLLNAIGAYSRARQACIVIDAGTAITVDFVDGEGVFHGGAISPGVRMMLKSLHQQTAALPELAYTPPDPARGPLGKDTAHAMLIGVTSAARGLTHLLIDRYAEFYGAYPRVIATGGDARALFEGDELVETIVPDLTLVGLAEVCRRELGEAAAEAEED